MKKILLLTVTICLLIACSSGDTSNGNGDNFDRTAMLTNWADNIIIPSYTAYQAKVQVLLTAVATFNTAPTETNLQVVRSSWTEAYKAYQKTSQFYFGKAMEIHYNEKANTYPTDIVSINSNISSGSYDLELLSQYSKQGFPAIDYLINGLGATDANIVSFYTTNTNAANYKKYLTELTTQLKSNIDLVVTNWNTSYRTSYIASNGNSVSSSVNITTNLFVKNLEKYIRSGKIGIPAGVFSSGALFPEKVEGLYHKTISKELLTVALQAEQDFFNGKHFNSTATGPSLQSYLDYVKAVRSGQNLSTIINNQFTAIFTANTNLSTNLSAQISSDNSKMISSYDAIQQNVVYIKLDMMQALNITLDYVDSDGD
ncbi:imelysin family protein [Flavobacterium cellulosilyticum]|uniref:Iron-regulated protein A n=1 Tax=Flavobacterium cellulosilyticum TaxID=2541731 RepID=A0A4R5CBL8_9FLAO|nr:imelysin family protein [Flavobacterium cellulosilyticum]TDD96166.1 iron-regulated protein A precursor [Flavobacterium cellulosilyticum]